MRYFVLISLMVLGLRVTAQDSEPGGFHFQPPRPPPPMDSAVEMDEDDEDGIEIGDEPTRPLPPSAGPPPSMAPPPMYSPPPSAGFSGGFGGGGISKSNNAAGAVRFQVVEGEFYVKGQKRTRGKRGHE